MDRKKKLRLIQSFLLLIGILVIFFSYIDRRDVVNNEIISKEVQEKIAQQLDTQSENTDTFYNIEYSGFDLEGNRYILKAEEATKNKSNQELIKMFKVDTSFFFLKMEQS